MTGNWSFDPIAFCAALFAIWFAWHESRKSNNVLLATEKCESSLKQSILENEKRWFWKFKLLLRNSGRPMHNVKVTLSFNGPGGSGTFSVPIGRTEREPCTNGEFSKGMIAEFEFKSYTMSAGERAMLCMLEDAVRQCACVNVYSQGYLAKSFRVGSLMDRMKERWNAFASWSNQALKRQVGTSPEGMPVVRHYRIMPEFASFRRSVMDFVNGCREDG